MTDQNDDNGQGGGALRKQLEDALAKLKTIETENASLKTQSRQAAISGLLTEKKYNPKVAKLIPADIEPTAEAVQTWLDEYGDVFNITKTDDSGAGDASSDASGQVAIDDEDAQSYIQTMRQMGSVNGGLLPPERAKELLAKINSPDLKQEDLVKLIHEHGGGYGMG